MERGAPAKTIALILLDPRGLAEPVVSVIGDCRNAHPGTPILLLAETEDGDHALSLLRAGVRGLLSREAPDDDLRKAVTAVAAGELWMRRALMSRALTSLLEPAAAKQSPTTRSGSELLTDRESEIVEAAVAGMSNREIADRFAIGESTVKTHLHHAFEKLNLVRRSQLQNRVPWGGR